MFEKPRAIVRRCGADGVERFRVWGLRSKEQSCDAAERMGVVTSWIIPAWLKVFSASSGACGAMSGMISR